MNFKRFVLLLGIELCIGVVFNLQGVYAAPVSPSSKLAPHQITEFPSNLDYPGDNVCLTDFPLPAYTNFLPVITQGDPTEPLTSTVTAPVLPKQPGSLVPLGDQLGDVGQYYSQVTPSATSTLNFWNITPITQTFAMTLYDDIGAVASSLHSCVVAPQSTLSLWMGAGKIQTGTSAQPLPVSTVCESVEQTVKTAEQQDTADLHGIYHAEIATEAENALRITLDTASDKSQSSILYHTAGRYQAIGQRMTLSTIHIPAVLATRNKENWWDTELVVQNTSNQVAKLEFEFCDNSGHCFHNNLATLNAHERRIFLASHLLYENVDGFLEKRAGWFSVTLAANSPDVNATRPQLAVLANIFKQPVSADAIEPKAEQGSNCLFQVEPTALTSSIAYSATVSNDMLLRIYNPGHIPNTVNVNVVDGQGQTLATLSKTVPPSGSSAWAAPELFAGLIESRLDEIVSLQVQASQTMVAFAWQAGLVLQPPGENELERVRYAPLVAAPTVAFRWDNRRDEDNVRLGYPSSKFGLAESSSQYYAQRPLWARMLNWYNWVSHARYCNQTVSDTDLYSTYIPLWVALGGAGSGDCSIDRCRQAFNSPLRLSMVRNTISSSCTGRPLLLANEPDIEGQAYMTYHELGRMIYQLRSWPGELYSPVIASPFYDRPTYGPESTAFCKAAVANNQCPGDAACATCIQDGYTDGESDAHDVSFKGLEDYFDVPGRWVSGESWRFEDTIEGMALHIYALVESFADASYWRSSALQQYRDRADKAGWPIIVSEYSFVCWPDENGKCSGISACTISDHLDDLRQFLQRDLGNYEAAHNYNPKKLFWFQTGCDLSPQDCYATVCLFRDAARLTSPVGTCWYQDAVQGGSADIQCSEACPQSFLPFINQ